jgi:hypothetical protein
MEISQLPFWIASSRFTSAQRISMIIDQPAYAILICQFVELYQGCRLTRRRPVLYHYNHSSIHSCVSISFVPLVGCTVGMCRALYSTLGHHHSPYDTAPASSITTFALLPGLCSKSIRW